MEGQEPSHGSYFKALQYIAKPWEDFNGPSLFALKNLFRMAVG